MRSLSIACSLMVILAATIAVGAEPARRVPADTMREMGFGKVQVMSDRDGQQVRGKGSYAIVWGTGYGPIVRRHFAHGSSFMISGGTVYGGHAWAFAR